MKQTNIEEIIEKYNSDSNSNDRLLSFDYCYNYFRTTDDLLKDTEKSCLTLSFYLASWGMYRGSSFLLQKSLTHYIEVIKYISTLEKSVWEIDADKYSNENIELIIKIYSEIKQRIIPSNQTDLTLVSKILLGVFGFIPAFDSKFCSSFGEIYKGKCGFSVVNKKSLGCLKSFYESNKESIDKLAEKSFSTSFLTGEKTKINYPKAKIIDMYGFSRNQ